MDTKFTKGPWAVAKNSSYFDIGADYNHIHNGLGEHVCIGVMADQEANAHLIAAAPEMYEALDDVVKQITSADIHGIDIELIIELLAKARGEQ